MAVRTKISYSPSFAVRHVIGEKGMTLCALCQLRHEPELACLPVPPASDAPTAPSAADRKANAAKEPVDDLCGTMVGSFRLSRCLGRGGMGTVYLGEHPVIGSKVAIKFLHPSLCSNRSLVQRFYDEARAVNLIGHESIVNIFDLNILAPNRYYIVMEYLAGETLSALMTRRPPGAALSLKVLIQLCDALHAAHEQGIIHRDVKPDNVFVLDRTGHERLVKLVDFGIAKLRDRRRGDSVAGAREIIGTPEYMAPEQWAGSRVDARTDVYALGVLAYRLATGRLPFEETTVPALMSAHTQTRPRPPSEVLPGVAPGWERVILKALEKSPEDRFQTAAALAEALFGVLESLPDTGVAELGPLAPAGSTRSRTLRSRLQMGIEVEVSTGAGPAERMLARDVSRGGMFLCTDRRFPPLFTQVKLSVRTGTFGGELHAEVVRHVSAQEAKAWNMSPGFAVQFVGLSAEQKALVSGLVAMPPAEGATLHAVDADDEEASRALEALRQRMTATHYGFLELPLDADFAEIRSRAHNVRKQLETWKPAAWSTEQRRHVKVVLARLDTALATLGEPRARAAYDAELGNFLGVTICLMTGLAPAEVEALHRAYRERRPELEAQVARHVARAQSAMALDDEDAALTELGAALEMDPLNLQLHQSYWQLKGGFSVTRAREVGSPGASA